MFRQRKGKGERGMGERERGGRESDGQSRRGRGEGVRCYSMYTQIIIQSFHRASHDTASLSSKQAGIRDARILSGNIAHAIDKCLREEEMNC